MSAGYEAIVTLFQTLPEFDNLLKMLNESGLTSYSLRIKAPALILAGQRSSSVLLSGILPEQEKNVTLIHRRLTAGGHLTADKDSLLIGQRLAVNLQAAGWRRCISHAPECLRAAGGQKHQNQRHV